jgi:hypothetical protein
LVAFLEFSSYPNIAIHMIYDTLQCFTLQVAWG